MAHPRPVPTAETRPFWDGLRDHELRLRWCPNCERFQHPRVSLCPDCLATPGWRAVSARVKLASWTVVYRSFTPGFVPPYGVASVSPVEAPDVRLDTMIDVADVGDLRPGTDGRLAFVDEPGGWTVHSFHPD